MNDTTYKIDFATLPSAGIFRRLFAIVYDLLLIAAISAAYAILVWIVRSIAIGSIENHDAVQGPVSFVIMAGWWFALASYFNWSWKKRGQTLAMKVWRLRLQQPDGTLATAKQRWNRCLIAPVSLCSGLGLLWCFIDKDGDTLHDKLTRTKVVLLPKKVN